MNCEELIECLAPVLEALKNDIVSQVNNFNQYGVDEPGNPMSEEDRGENLAQETNPACNKNVLWAQCLAIVQYTNRAISDLVEKLEIASNAAELTDIVTDAPIVNLVVDNLGVEVAEGVVNYLLDAAREQYTAQYDIELENALACQLFCAALDDCALSVDLIYSVFYDNVSGEVPDDPLTLIEFVNTLAGLNMNGDNVVNFMFWFAWAGAKLLSVLVSKVFANNFSLNQLLQVAVSEADTDWEVLCTTCPVTCTFEVQAANDPFVSPFGQNSFIPLQSGIEYTVFASGTWLNGTEESDADGEESHTSPLSLVPSANIASLVYKIGSDGEWLAGGVEFNITPGSDNFIWFAMNNVPGVYGGTSGELCIDIDETTP